MAQQPVAVNDFLVNHPGFMDQEIVSVLQGSKGLAALRGKMAMRVGRRPVLSGVELVARRLTLQTAFLTSVWAVDRRALLTALSSERGQTRRLLVADQVPPEGWVAGFGPWDLYQDSDDNWFCRSIIRDADGDARVTAALSGAIHFVDGRESRQRALVIEGATTNLVDNPSLETGTTGWAADGSGASIARTTDEHRFDAYSLEVTPGSTATRGAYYTLSLTTSTRYSVGVWVKATEDESLSLRLYDVTAADDLEVTDSATATGDWQYMSLSVETNNTGSHRVRILRTSTSTDVFYVDGVQVEEEDYPTTVAIGSPRPGYSWDSTEHASDSDRTATAFSLDDNLDLVSRQDTLSFRAVIRAPHDADDLYWPDSSYNSLFDIRGASDSHRIQLYYNPSSDIFSLNLNNNIVANTSAQTFDRHDWIEIVATIDFGNNSYKLYVDGSADGSGTTSLAAPTLTAWRLGGNYDDTDQVGWAFAEFDVFDRVLGPGEILGLYNGGGAHGRARYVDVVCEETDALMLGGQPTERGLTCALLVDQEVRWRSADGDWLFWNAYDDDVTQFVDVDSDDDVYPVLYVTPETAHTGDSYLYRRFVQVEWKVDSRATRYPVLLGTPDTATLVSGGKMRSDGNDLRVFSNGIEIDRWINDMNTASTEVWANLDFEADQSGTLTVAIAATGDVDAIYLDEDITQWPSEGLALIGSEIFYFASKNNASKSLTDITRAMRNTSMAAHSVSDSVRWLQHDLYIVYGNANASAPDVDDDYQPAFNLATSTNDSWDYDDFGDDNGKRAMSWVKETVLLDMEIVRDSYAESFLDFTTSGAYSQGSPWDTIGIHIRMYAGGYSNYPGYTGKGAGRWYIFNPCGITQVVLANTSTDDNPGPLELDYPRHVCQSKESTGDWNDETGISSTTYTLDSGGADKFFALYVSLDVPVAENDDANRVSRGGAGDATLTLYSTLTPDSTIGSEESNYELDIILTNETKSETLRLYFPTMTLGETLKVNTYNRTVEYLLDGSSQVQARTLVGGARSDWFRLVRGENELSYEDRLEGTENVKIWLEWERRDWE